MKTVPFIDPQKKLRRATKHIAELDALIVEYISSDGFGINITEDTISNTFILKLDAVRPLSEDIPLAIGDFRALYL